MFYDVLASKIAESNASVESETESVSSQSPLKTPVASTAEVKPTGFSAFDSQFGSPHLTERERGHATRGSAPLDDDIDVPPLHPAGIEADTETLRRLFGEDSEPPSIQLETRGLTSQKKAPHQAELWARQTIHKNTIAAKLREHGRVDVADGLENCHSEAIWATCKACGTSKRFLNRCEKFYCPECQPTLSRGREKAVSWWANEMRQPKHVVLTLQNMPFIDKATVMHAKKCFARLRRRKFAKNWEGGFYNWEVTKEKAGSVKNGHVLAGGWHLHIHALVEAKWIDSGVLSEQWNIVTGGFGRIVKVMDARRVDYLKEVTKYAVKGSQLAAWTGAEIAMFIDAFEGVRTFGVFGTLYGKRTEWKAWIDSVREHGLKCECGCSQWWYRNDDEFQMTDAMLVVDAPTRGSPNVDKSQLHFAIM